MSNQRYTIQFHIERGVFGIEIYRKRNGFEPITHKENLRGIFKSKESAQSFIDNEVEELRDALKTTHPCVAVIHDQGSIHENLIP